MNHNRRFNEYLGRLPVPIVGGVLSRKSLMATSLSLSRWSTCFAWPRYASARSYRSFPHAVLARQKREENGKRQLGGVHPFLGLNNIVYYAIILHILHSYDTRDTRSKNLPLPTSSSFTKSFIMFVATPSYVNCG